MRLFLHTEKTTKNNLLKKTMNTRTKNVLAIVALGALTLAGSIESPIYGSPLPPGGYVDLTYAAEKALPAVVHIKYV